MVAVHVNALMLIEALCSLNGAMEAFDSQFYPNGIIFADDVTVAAIRCDRCGVRNRDGDPRHVSTDGYEHALCMHCRSDLWHRGLLRCIKSAYFISIDMITAIPSRYAAGITDCGVCPAMHERTLGVSMRMINSDGTSVATTKERDPYPRVVACNDCFYSRYRKHDRPIADELRLHIAANIERVVRSCFATVLPLPARDSIVSALVADFEKTVETARMRLLES